jgi:hypothetical protein
VGAAAGKTVTPGWVMTEEPAAATQKVAYQAAAALAEGPGQVGASDQETAAAAPELAVPNSTAQDTLSPGHTATPVQAGTATASPVSGQGTTDPQAQNSAAAGQEDTLPLVAGVLILVGGSLLAALAFFVMRSEKR